MTISNVGSGTGAYSGDLSLDMEGRFALLVMEHEESQQNTDQAAKQLARERFIAASNAEVEALRDEAGDVRFGAIVQGAASFTAASIKLVDTLSEPECDPLTHRTPTEKPWGEMGAATLDGIAQPLGKYFGDAAVADDRADGKQAATAAQLAQSQMDDSQEAIQRSDKRQDKALDWLASTDANEAGAMTGIIAGLA